MPLLPSLTLSHRGLNPLHIHQHRWRRSTVRASPSSPSPSPYSREIIITPFSLISLLFTSPESTMLFLHLEMPWWKSSSSSSSSTSSPTPKGSSSTGSSPSKNARRESAFRWTKRGELSQHQQPRHVRQWRLRPVAEVETMSSMLVSRSPSSLDSLPGRSSSLPVVLPLPLPLPDFSHINEGCAAGAACGGSGCASCRPPSLKGAAAVMSREVEDGGGCGAGSGAAIDFEVNGEKLPSVAGRSLGQNTPKILEHGEVLSKGYKFSSHRKAIHDPKFVESVAFRLNIPAKSAPKVASRVLCLALED